MHSYKQLYRYRSCEFITNQKSANRYERIDIDLPTRQLELLVARSRCL